MNKTLMQIIAMSTKISTRARALGQETIFHNEFSSDFDVLITATMLKDTLSEEKDSRQAMKEFLISRIDSIGLEPLAKMGGVEARGLRQSLEAQNDSISTYELARWVVAVARSYV